MPYFHEPVKLAFTPYSEIVTLAELPVDPLVLVPMELSTLHIVAACRR